MSEESEKLEKSKAFHKRWSWIIGVALVLSIGGTIYDLYLTHKENKEKELQLNKKNSELDNERAEKNSCVSLKDSLFRENTKLSIYKTLTQAMVYRDDITKQLKYKVGEMVYIKSDSARVVIEDIVIGGSKYNFYVKYKVKYKDNTSHELVPELIY